MSIVAARRGQGGAGARVPLDPTRKLLREARVARALREVAGALGASLELDELLELVLGKLTDLVEAERSVLFLLDEQKRELVSRAASASEERVRLPLGDGLLGHVARTGRAARLDEGARSKHAAEWDEVLGTTTRSAILTPLKNNLSRTIGVLVALNKRGEPAFSDDDEEIVSVLAKQAAIAIDNSRLLVTLIRKNQQLLQAQEQLTRRVRDLELLFELERSTAHASSLEGLARAVLERLARACNAEGAVLVLTEQGASANVEYTLLRTLRGPEDLSEKEGTFHSNVVPQSEGVLSNVVASRTPVQMDVTGVPFNHQGVVLVRSLIGEPLEGEGSETAGALGLLNKRGGPFTAEDLGLLRLVSANVSTAVRLFNTNSAREREERLSSIGRLLSQVVHDLKSPLTVISGYVQLMEESKDRATRQGYAREILKQFQALGAMQREVLAFARGETQVFARKVLLDQFFLELHEQLQHELSGKKIELVLDVQRKLTGHFDSERVTRALQNLVRNAAEALGARGGRVTIEASAAGTSLLLRVLDDGPGIPPEIAPRLFQSFVTSGKQEGTGLGLAIVKRIVEEHGGSIRLLDVPRGACFEILLPNALVVADERKSARSPAMNGAGASAERAPTSRSNATSPASRAKKKPSRQGRR